LTARAFLKIYSPQKLDTPPLILQNTTKNIILFPYFRKKRSKNENFFQLHQKILTFVDIFYKNLFPFYFFYAILNITNWEE